MVLKPYSPNRSDLFYSPSSLHFKTHSGTCMHTYDAPWQESSPGCSTVHPLPHSGDLTLVTSHQSIFFAKSAPNQRGIIVYLCVVVFGTKLVGFRLAPPYPSTLSFLWSLDRYLVLGSPSFFLWVSKQYMFYEIGLQPYAQSPAILEDRWVASSSSSSSGRSPPTCLAHIGDYTNSYATASLA